MNLLKCLSGIAITFVLTTSVAADFAFTPEQASGIVRAYDNNSPVPLSDDMAASGRQSAIDCRDGTGDSVTCGAGLCTHVQATYDLLRDIANCADASDVIEKGKQKSCKGPLGNAQNIFKPLANFCRCDGATTC